MHLAKWMKVCLLACLIASLGFDRISLRINEMTFRSSYIFYLFVFLWLWHKRQIRLSKVPTMLIGGFVLLSIPSLFVSANPIKSIVYIFWIITNFVLIFLVFSTFARMYKKILYNSLIVSFRLQIVIAAIMALLGLNPAALDRGGWYYADRAHLFYYEPSFFAIALTTYCAIVSVRIMKLGVRSSWLDLGMLTIALFTTKSALLMIIIVIIFGFSFIFLRLTFKSILFSLTLALLTFAGAYFYAMNGTDLVAQTLHGILTSDDPVQYLVARAENRVPRMQCAWDVFLAHPLSGVGLGAYEAYTYTADLRYCLERGKFLYNQHDFITGVPPINIYIELLATTGIFASLTFFAFLLRLVFAKRIKRLDPIQLSYLIGLITMLIIMNFQATYLTLCIWMALGIYHGSVQRTKSLYRYRIEESISTSTYSIAS